MADISQQLSTIASQPTSQRPASYAAVLDQLLSQPRSALPADQLKQALATYLDQAAFSDLNSTGGGLVVGRQVLTSFEKSLAAAAAKLPAAADATGEAPMQTEDDAQDPNAPAIRDVDVRREIIEGALERMSDRVLSFEEQASALRFQLADLLEAEEDWAEAAKTLQGIPLDSGHRTVSDLQKLKTYIRIVRLHLEADDPVAADVYLKRASMVIHNVPGAAPAPPGSAAAAAMSTNGEGSDAMATEADKATIEEGKVLGLVYRLSQARIYDAQRKFAEAAMRFFEMSYVAEIDENERTQMLSAAVTASILSPAGPQRSRILASLIRDERTSSLPQHTILSKVFLDQIVRPEEIASFEKLLAPHQKARLAPSANEKALAAVAAAEEEERRRSGGQVDDTEANASSSRTGPSTVLDRAMMEHNVLAASRVYSNITLSGLGALLDVTPSGAETIARRMIEQRRLRASIDQVEGLVLFRNDPRGGEGTGIAGGLGQGTGGEATGADAAETGDDATAELEDDQATWTRRWDANIARTAAGLEDICARLRAKGDLPTPAVSGTAQSA